MIRSPSDMGANAVIRGGPTRLPMGVPTKRYQPCNSPGHGSVAPDTTTSAAVSDGARMPQAIATAPP